MCAKIDRARQNFAAMQATLCCPLCGGALRLSDNSFRCPAEHCYDLAAKNYLNLAPAAKPPVIYDEQLFLTRRRVFEGGFYDRLTDALTQYAAGIRQRLNRPLTIIDAGCGEGFFARRLLRDLTPANAEIIALDLARDGVMLAAQAEPALKCLIADLAALPFPDNSADIILNILSPANYREFQRVLRPGGLLLKVIPGANYLRQVREAYQLSPGEESEAAALFRAIPAQQEETRLTYTMPVNAAQAADFLQMSPLAEHRQPPAAGFAEITIDLWLLAARF